MTELRINARLDEETAADLQLLRKALGDVSITDALKHALRLGAQEIRDRERARAQKQVWIDSGFVGGFEGPEDLSTNYKRYFAEYLDEKYPRDE